MLVIIIIPIYDENMMPRELIFASTGLEFWQPMKIDWMDLESYLYLIFAIDIIQFNRKLTRILWTKGCHFNTIGCSICSQRLFGLSFLQ